MARVVAMDNKTKQIPDRLLTDIELTKQINAKKKKQRFSNINIFYLQK